MITIQNLSYFLGERALYQNVSLQIKPKDKIGLIGANGTGKSTLLRLIIGEYKADEGFINSPKDTSIGFLNQDLLSYQTEESILTVAMQAFSEANRIQQDIEKVLHQMEVAYEDALVDRLARLQERYEALDGYSLQAKAEKILEGLGFRTEQLHHPLKQFSGGWRMRVMLAKLLLQKPDLLMMDEPTNHLDLPSIEWIESYLDNYEGAYIIVSHDRHFLDNTTDRTLEVANQTINDYAGNYSFYLEERELRRTIQQNAFENQQAKIRQTERFIERFKAKASKARQVQSRVKQLDKIDRIDEVVDEQARVHFKFQFKSPSGRNVLELKHITKSYPGVPLFKNAEALIERGDKIALIGANGKGKSTLLRILAGTETSDGERSLGHNVIQSHFAQHQLESLNLDHNLLEELVYMGSGKSETELRGILGCFLFSKDEVMKKIKVLSGGEKSRVALAKTLISEANFLLLDEPTNHLDMQSVNILAQALQQYQGSFVVISHDRYFISRVANKIWYIENEEIKAYPGDFYEYLEWLDRREDTRLPEPTKKVAKEEKKAEPLAPEAKDQLKKLYKDLEKLESQVAEEEQTITRLEADMAAPEVYGQSEEMARYVKLVAEAKARLSTKQEQWNQIAETITELESV